MSINTFQNFALVLTDIDVQILTKYMKSLFLHPVKVTGAVYELMNHSFILNTPRKMALPSTANVIAI